MSILVVCNMNSQSKDRGSNSDTSAIIQKATEVLKIEADGIINLIDRIDAIGVLDEVDCLEVSRVRCHLQKDDNQRHCRQLDERNWVCSELIL